MNLFGKSLDNDVAIIAEIGVNHEGDARVAQRLLELAAESGADAVKFQSYTPERYASASDPARLQRVRGFALDEAAHRDLAATAQRLGVAFLSTPLSEDWVPLLAELGDAIKIASGDLTFAPTIRAAARTDKPIILSTGLGKPTEIETALSWVREESGKSDISDKVVLLHCVAAYPVPIEEASILSIPYLAGRFGLTVGYSNHVVGPEACWAAIAHGAKIVEVHFTDQKTGRTFRDHELSFEPDDLRALVDVAPRIRQSLGTPGKDRQKSELPLLDAIRKGVVAARNLEAGTVLTASDLMFARPAGALPASEIDKIIGLKIREDIPVGTSIGRDGRAVRPA